MSEKKKERATKRRLKELLAVEISSTRFRENPDYLMAESVEVQMGWDRACLELADKIRASLSPPRRKK